MLKHIRTFSFVLLCIALSLLLLLSVILAIHVGAVELKPSWVFQILTNHIIGLNVFPQSWPGYADGIVWGMRLPKVLVAACVGAGLSIVGIMMQAMTKNAMADPYLLGISSGASAGAAAAILLGVFSVGTGAFAGAMLSSVLVFLLSGASGRVSATKLILSGVAVSSLFSAVTNLLIFLQSNEKKLSAVLFWMTGSFASVTWNDVLPVTVSLLVCIAVFLLIHRCLDALLLGEEMAVTLGVDVPSLKILMIVLSALVTGIMVNVSGTIGFVGLIGPNGSGKSTLLKTIYRVNKASKGAVYLNGTDMSRMTGREIARQMAVVAQENPVNFDFSVMEILMIGLYAKRPLLAGDSPGDIAVCEKALASVGMLEFQNRSFLSLSGGEKQKVLIAGAFARNPELILLDEPTNHLDIGYQFLILDMMKQQKDVTVFTSMHDMNMAMQYCDFLIALQNGRVFASGVPREVLTRENLRQLFQVDVIIDPDSGHIRYTGFSGGYASGLKEY